MNEIIFTVTESLDGGFEAKAVGHSIYTQCNSYEELHDILRDAVKCHFDSPEMPYKTVIKFCRRGGILPPVDYQ